MEPPGGFEPEILEFKIQCPDYWAIAPYRQGETFSVGSLGLTVSEYSLLSYI